MNANEYDLIVIGAGPAGEKGAARAAYWGKKVALIERSEVLGGTMTTGGVPAKTLRETALNISGLRQRGLYGVDLSYKDKLDIGTFMYRERQVRTAAQNAVAKNLENHNVDRYTGFASFQDPHTIQVSSDQHETTLTGKVFLIATGSRPVQLPIFPYEQPNVYDSTSLLDMKNLPNHLMVAGAGIVGSEFACVFAALGIPVTLIHSGDRLFPFADHEISTLLMDNLQQMGVKLVINARVDKVIPSDKDDELTVVLASGDEITGDALLAAVGRASNVDGLGLDNASVETGRRGLILVNQNFQTNVSHIYAAGDVIGFPALSSTSMEQARAAMAHAFDLDYGETNLDTLPYGLWTVPEISMVGETEESLTEKGIPYVVGKVRYDNNPRGLILSDEGLMKLIFSAESRKLLGVHILGQEACELIGAGLIAITAGATLNHFISVCFNFPSLMDMYKYAAYDALARFDKLEGVKGEQG